MNVLHTTLPAVLLIEPRVFRDARGSFFEGFNRRAFAAATGVDAEFVQDNQSSSERDVLRGLHYQVGRPQGKLVRVLRGEIFDVAVDLREGSAHFRRWTGFTLSADNGRMAWIPPGFAHGFVVTSERADVLYKVTDYWSPAHERTLAWDDPAVGVRWPLQRPPRLSDKDRAASHAIEKAA